MTTVQETNGTKLFQFDVVIAEIPYRVEAESHTKAVTEAIKRFRGEFPDSLIPSGLLRFSAQTSKVSLKPQKSWNRESLEELSRRLKGEVND